MVSSAPRCFEGGEHDDRRVGVPDERAEHPEPSSGSGIAMSVSTTSTGTPVGGAPPRRGRPPRPPARAGRAAAAAGQACGSSSTTRMTRRLIGPGQGARLRGAGRDGPGLGPVRVHGRKANRGGGAHLAGSDAQGPRWASTRRLVARPSPCPGSPRASGARKKGWYSRVNTSSVIPGPLSVISSTASSPSPAKTTTRAPGRAASTSPRWRSGSGRWTAPAARGRPPHLPDERAR